MSMSIYNILKSAKKVSGEMVLLSNEKTNAILASIADEILKEKSFLLQENNKDLEKLEANNPLYDRLKLSPERLDEIAKGIKKLIDLPSPLNKIISEERRPNGLDIKRISVPFGVVGVIYEARPNVTFDVAALCLKSGNVSVLKGSKNADASNTAIVSVIHKVLQSFDVSENAVTLLPSSHEAVNKMLHAEKFVDVLIPRGGANLINFVRHNATVPVIETGAGTCHAYFDEFADTEKGAKIIENAKTRRVGVCNALDCLIVNKKRLSDLPRICQNMSFFNVVINADSKAYNALKNSYPLHLLRKATRNCYGKEFLDYEMSIKTVDSIEKAIEHVQKYGSGHSECIITEDSKCSDLFLRTVDAACVYQNAPTSFSDGMQFGLGAEIGISTQKLHARGPMGLEELTTYKWLIHGNGQIRP